MLLFHVLSKLPKELLHSRCVNYCNIRIKHSSIFSKNSSTSAVASKPDNNEQIDTSTEKTVEAIAVPVATPPTIDVSLRGSLKPSGVLERDKRLDKPKLVTPSQWIPSPSPTITPNIIMNQYKKLSKFRLTSLVVITAMGGYAMAPAAFDLATFGLCFVGTGLVSAAANAINQYHEVPFDSQMSRTKNRVLVTGQLTPLHTIAFASTSAAIGLSMLYFGVNGLTAALGVGNLMLYTSIYTPLKRVSILNTWVGSVVGAIPPLIGWAGCTGSLETGAWVLAGLLYAWQFPHFNALSWNLRPDYSRAGYRMMAVTNPELCRRTALRYTVVLSSLSLCAPVLDVTNWWFALETFPLNAYFCYLAYKFYRKSDGNSSRSLFRFSLIHLPVLMLLFLLNKKRWFFKEHSTEITAEAINSAIPLNSLIVQAPHTINELKMVPVAVAADTTVTEQSKFESVARK